MKEPACKFWSQEPVWSGCSSWIQEGMIKDKNSSRWLLSSEIRDKLIVRNTGKGDMTQVMQESVKMLEMLPESEQELANQLIKRIVLAWDPDYTKLTPDEKKWLEEAEQRIDSGDYVREDDVDW